MNDPEFFQKLAEYSGAYLYGHGLEGDVWLGYLLSEDGGPNLSLEKSWTDYWGLPRRGTSRARSRPNYRNGGCYLFCGEEPELNGNFMEKLKAFLVRLNGTYGDYYRYIFWFENPNSDDLKGQYIPIEKKPNSVDSGQVVDIKGQGWIKLKNIQIRLDGGVEISLDSENVQFLLQQLPGVYVKLYNAIGSIYFGEVAPNDDTPYVCIPLTGTAPGALKFDASLRVDAQNNEFETVRVGLKYFYKNEDEDICSQLYPVFGLPTTNPILFRVSLDPMHPLDHVRSNFTFVGYGGILPPTFTTWFRLDLGHVVTLTPKPNESSLVFSADKTRLQDPPKPQDDTLYLTPSGDYVIGLEDPSKFHPTADRPFPQLLCGLSGLESISFHLNDVVTFCPDREAYAPAFPIKEATLDDPDPSESKPLLDKTYTTSWMKVTSPSKDEMNVYFSQPQGAPLYAKNDGADSPQSFLGHHQTPSAQLGEDTTYPLVPYASTAPHPDDEDGFSKDDIPNFEFHIISPFRRGQILFNDEAEKAGYRTTTGENPSEPTPATTPQGLISYVRSDGSWSSLLLAKNLEKKEALQFEDLDPTLQKAFQTNQLFLVVTDPVAKWNLKSKIGADPDTDQVTFDNTISIGDWTFEINAGEENSFNDYRNVLIFKFCEGKLADRVKNPKKWTDADKFNDASIGGPEAVSQWLQDYIADAERQEGGYFTNFIDIINNEDWKGILALKVDIDLDQFPSQLEGLLSGIDLDRFNVHHLGIEGNKIDGEAVEIKETSSMFGLIYYADPNYDGSGSPIPPTPGEDYDFRVLTLKVLFENSAIKDFESLAQLTINKIFDHQVTSTGDPKKLYNAILLNGSCQRHGDETVYVLDTVDDNSFYFDSNVLHKVEITKAQFNTMGKNKIDGGEGGDDRMEVSSRFEFTGYIDFEILKEGKGEELRNFDIFSFGNDDGKDDPRKGLSFSGLGLNMTYPEDEPSKKEFTFDPSKIAFSLEKSTPRKASLFENFALVFEGFVNGTSETKPADGGFLQVGTALKQAGPSGSWQGFKFRLNMGTPGELAGKVSLTSSLLLAWSAGSQSDSDSYNVFIGIKLPGTGGGAKLLDLQGVLKLSIGDVWLAYVKDDTGEKEAFILTLTDIALKFLGIAKLPPGGSTSFYLFGDSAAKARGCGLGWYAMYKKSKDSMMNEGTSPQAIGEGVRTI